LAASFFVHKSKVKVKAGAPEHYEETAAFEFLHNTFGEFLTAEFIIRQAMAEVATLKKLKEAEDLRVLFEERLSAADGFSKAWFASLVYTPLFTRPVVLEMMRVVSRKCCNFVTALYPIIITPRPSIDTFCP